MVVRRFFLVLFVLFFSLFPCFSVDRVVMFMAAPDVDILIREEALSVLAMQDWLAVRVYDVYTDNPEELDDIASEIGADSVLLLYMQDEKLVFSARDFISDTELWHYEQELPPRISSPVLARAVISPLEDKLAELGALVKKEKPVFGEGVIVISALPGTALSGIFEDAVVVGDKGIVRLRLPAPTTYVIRAEKDGYRPVETVVSVVPDEKKRIDLQQSRVYGLSVSVGLQHFSYPYAGLGYWLIPSKLRLDWDVKWYGIGYYLPTDVYSSVSSGFVSFPLIETGVGFTVPFYRFSSGVFLWFSGSFNLRFVYPEGYAGLDPVSSFFTELGAGIDFPLFYAGGDWSFFFESFFISYITDDRKLIYAATKDLHDVESPGDVYNAFFVPGARLGLRVGF